MCELAAHELALLDLWSAGPRQTLLEKVNSQWTKAPAAEPETVPETPVLATA